MLAAACAQSEDRAPFFNPTNPSNGQGGADGGAPDVDGGGVVDGGGGGGGGIAGTGAVTGGPDPEPVFAGMRGNPTFDPEQVYVHGMFDSVGLDHNDPYAEPCADTESAIADWSSPKDDWRTDLGLTVGLACEIEDPRIRVDGSIVYEQINRMIRLMFEEVASADPGSTTVTVMAGGNRPHGNDTLIVDCWATSRSHPQFRHFLHPETGSLVHVCFPAEGDAPYVHFTAVGEPFAVGEPSDPDVLYPVPDGFLVAHLGYEDYALVHKLDNPNDMGVSSGESVAEFSVASEFGFQKIQTVRATEDGFYLLVVRATAPPELELWQVSYAGELSQVATSTSGADITLNENNCPLRGGPFGTDVIDKLPSAGCMCALEPTGTAVCLATESGGAEIVVRFDFSEPNAAPETVYRVDEDPFLKGFKGLVTGS